MCFLSYSLFHCVVVFRARRSPHGVHQFVHHRHSNPMSRHGHRGAGTPRLADSTVAIHPIRVVRGTNVVVTPAYGVKLSLQEGSAQAGSWNAQVGQSCPRLVVHVVGFQDVQRMSEETARHENHSRSVGRPFLHSRALVQRQVFEDLGQVLPTGRNLSQNVAVLHLLFEEVGCEELATHSSQDVFHFTVPVVLVVLDPLEHSVVYLPFLLDVQFIFSYKSNQLVR